jgi:DNA-binding GntR family transcriptional regulator
MSSDKAAPASGATQTVQAHAEIRRRILILEVRPEERLKEEEWAKKLKLGRLAVREALTQLHGEGLVTRGAKGGFFVAGMSERDVHEIREVREILEVAAINLARDRLTAAQLKELETACDDFAYMAKKGYHTGACEADRHFHALLVAASGNRKLQRAYEACHIPLFHVRLGQSRDYIDDYAETETEHRGIVEALRAREIEKAIKRLRAHFERGEREVLSSD